MNAVPKSAVHVNASHVEHLASAAATPSPAASASDHVRATLAHRVLDRRGILLARIRRRLSMRTDVHIDPDDIFSTTLRRIDVLVSTGRLLEHVSDEVLLALATAVAINATRERVRSRQRGVAAMHAYADAPGVETHVDPFQRLANGEDAARRRHAGEGLLATLLPADLEILGLRLRGADWATIAGELGMTPAAAHRRYFRAIRTLAELARTGSNGSEAARNTAPPAAGIEPPVP
jgi:hypothetical protein